MKVLGIALLWLASMNAYSYEHQIASLFDANNVEGSILIESLDGKQRYQYKVINNERFVPASTFKIPNTLIILEEGLIKDPNEIIAWDGVERDYSPWNQDQTLRSAFQYSCVWCYQRYAKIIGDNKYHHYLKLFDYGNQLTGKEVTRFWLDGDLRVSVKDQVRFLRKLYNNDLPIKQSHINVLKDIMLSENNDKFKVWSKTGWAGKDGWFVGYLLAGGQIWFFANHIEIKQNSDLGLRKNLTMEAFSVLNIVQ